jgi:hypothetical protein
MKKIIPYAIVSIEFLISAYVAFCGYFLSGWFINDEAAARLAENDWNMIAATRVFYASIIALLMAGAFFIMNKYIFSHYTNGTHNKNALITSIVIFFMIVIPSIIGAIEFALKKPFM